MTTDVWPRWMQQYAFIDVPSSSSSSSSMSSLLLASSTRGASTTGVTTTGGASTSGGQRETRGSGGGGGGRSGGNSLSNIAEAKVCVTWWRLTVDDSAHISCTAYPHHSHHTTHPLNMPHTTHPFSQYASHCTQSGGVSLGGDAETSLRLERSIPKSSCVRHRHVLG